MALKDLFDLGVQGADYWQKNTSFDDAQDDLDRGFGRAENKVEKYAEPWIDQGLEHAQAYDDMGEFDLNFDDYLETDFYDWLRQDQQGGLERQYAASDQGLLSGGTLQDLNRDMTNWAGTQYGAEHGRQLAEYDTNKAYHQFPMTAGASMAQNTGNTLADISMARGGTRAQLEIEKSRALSQLLTSAGIEGQDQDSMIGSISDMFQKSGVGGSIIDFAKDLLGGGSGGGYVGDVFGDVMKDLGGLGGGGLENLGGYTPEALKALGFTGDSLAAAAKLASSTAGTLTGPAGSWAGAGPAQVRMASQGAQTAATSAGVGSQMLSFLTSAGGMGITAAVGSLLFGRDTKDAALAGGLTYLGATIGSAIPGVGTVIGGVIGGLASSVFSLGGSAKTDSVLMYSGAGTTDGYKAGTYSEGAFGTIGFKGAATRHFDNKDVKKYQGAFETITKIDDIISAALTPEENEAVLQAVLGEDGQRGVRKERNEGKIDPKKVMNWTFEDRQKTLLKTLGQERFDELQIADIYNGVLSNA